MTTSQPLPAGSVFSELAPALPTFRPLPTFLPFLISRKTHSLSNYHPQGSQNTNVSKQLLPNILIWLWSASEGSPGSLPLS